MSSGDSLIIDGESIVAEARPTSLELDIPAPLTYAEAQEAARRYSGFDYHPFPTCFVCGPDRLEADGPRIFAGPLPGDILWISNRYYKNTLN